LPPLGFLRASALASATTSGRLATLALAVCDALPLPSGRQLGDCGRLLEPRDGSEQLPYEDRSRGVLHEERRGRRRNEGVAGPTGKQDAGRGRLRFSRSRSRGAADLDRFNASKPARHGVEEEAHSQRQSRV